MTKTTLKTVVIHLSLGILTKSMTLEFILLEKIFLYFCTVQSDYPWIKNKNTTKEPKIKTKTGKETSIKIIYVAHATSHLYNSIVPIAITKIQRSSKGTIKQLPNQSSMALFPSALSPACAKSISSSESESTCVQFLLIRRNVSLNGLLKLQNQYPTILQHEH